MARPNQTKITLQKHCKKLSKHINQNLPISASFDTIEFALARPTDSDVLGSRAGGFGAKAEMKCSKSVTLFLSIILILFKIIFVTLFCCELFQVIV